MIFLEDSLFNNLISSAPLQRLGDSVVLENSTDEEFDFGNLHFLF
jgi:hypothetical protein